MTTLNMFPAGPESNSYCSILEADAYHAERLHNSNWTDADSTTKKKGLSWATRLIDNYMAWNGSKIDEYQILENPRYFIKYPMGYFGLYYKSILNSTYKWTQSSTNTNEYYLELSGGGDPSIDEPNYLILNGFVGHQGTFGSLEIAESSFGDNDTLGYSTVYYRPHDGKDPDEQDDDFVKIAYYYEKTDYDNGYILGTATDIRQATAEYANVLIGSDVTAASDTAGYKSLKVDVLSIEIDKYDRPSEFPDSVWSMLKNYGTNNSGSSGIVSIGRG